MTLNQPTKSKLDTDETLPVIPDKRYFTIGEVGALCGVKPHVLRYWEQEFPRLRPIKRRGNRRCYQHQDVVMARKIRKLLYEEGFTIEGARAKLVNAVSGMQETSKSIQTGVILKKMIADLEEVLQSLR